MSDDVKPSDVGEEVASDEDVAAAAAKAAALTNEEKIKKLGIIFAIAVAIFAVVFLFILSNELKPTPAG